MVVVVTGRVVVVLIAPLVVAVVVEDEGCEDVAPGAFPAVVPPLGFLGRDARQRALVREAA
jgi:hypothetical protein